MNHEKAFGAVKGKKNSHTVSFVGIKKTKNTEMSSYLHFVLLQHSQAFLELSVFLG